MDISLMSKRSLQEDYIQKRLESSNSSLQRHIKDRAGHG